jgi:uncharacterized protein (TIGR02594 family)
MNYRTRQPTPMREKASDAATLVRGLQSKSVLTFLGQKEGAGDDEWINVEFKPPGSLESDKGWVRLKHCEEIAAPPPEELNQEGFVLACILAQRRLNDLAPTAPWFVAPDFVIARAVIETGITNAGTKVAGSDGVGPLQVSSAEWESFLKSGPFAEGFSPAGRAHPIIQVDAATYRTHTDMKAISELKTLKPEPEDGPFQPSNLDVFHAYLLDSPAAAAAIIDVQEDPEKSNQSLKDVLKGALTEERMKAVFAARSIYMGTFDAPKTVGSLITETERALTAALQKAAALIETHAPEELPKLKEASASWFDEAEKAEAAGVNEHEQKHMQTILDYFAATSLGRQSKRLPWCGAFAAHCMKASKNEDLIPKGAAAAVSWKTFGVGIPIAPGQVPKGAVVVFSPMTAGGGTGHVAFFSEFINDGKSVRVLGGNQGRAVNRREFKTSKVVAIRWVETAPTHEEVLQSENVKPANLPPGDMEISQAAFDLIVAFEVTGQAAYERKYRGPIWPGVKSGITIGIGYDVGHQKEAQVRQDCAGILAPGMINALVTACGTRGPAAKALLPGLRGTVDVPWKEALQLFKVQSIPRWTAVVRKHLPNTDKLKPDSLGALVSLTYNRGPSFSKAGDRYAEMRAIRQHMASGNFAEIPGELRSMKRIWPTVAGLQRRREAEARLFEAGLR